MTKMLLSTCLTLLVSSMAFCQTNWSMQTCAKVCSYLASPTSNISISSNPSKYGSYIFHAPATDEELKDEFMLLFRAGVTFRIFSSLLSKADNRKLQRIGFYFYQPDRVNAVNRYSLPTNQFPLPNGLDDCRSQLSDCLYFKNMITLIDTLTSDQGSFLVELDTAGAKFLDKEFDLQTYKTTLAKMLYHFVLGKDTSKVKGAFIKIKNTPLPPRIDFTSQEFITQYQQTETEFEEVQFNYDISVTPQTIINHKTKLQHEVVHALVTIDPKKKTVKVKQLPIGKH